MIFSSDSPDRCTLSAKRRCVAESSVSSSISVMPRTPLIGVRISWLMLARNRDLARLAACAAAATSMASSALRRSRDVADDRGEGAGARLPLTENSSGNGAPSRRSPTRSPLDRPRGTDAERSPLPPAGPRYSAMTGIIERMSPPIACPASTPNSRSAARLNDFDASIAGRS